jgi:tetratricopeptide (TPR) repeat protein
MLRAALRVLRDLLRPGTSHSQTTAPTAVKGEERALEAAERLWREGTAASQRHEFEKALEAYQRALQQLSREEAPVLWAGVWVDIGRAHAELGIRSEGQAIHRHLSAAIHAFGRALKVEVYTREKQPQGWATTQYHLGNALREQGLRAEGTQAAELLGEAVAAYRRALEVYTREQHPQVWAVMQARLGNALQEQGERAEGEPRVRLMGEAVAAIREALEVYTREHQPLEWAMARNNLAAAHMAAGDWGQAAAICADVLSAFPEDVGARANLAECQVATGRCAEAEATLALLLAAPVPEVSVGARALEIVALLAQGKTRDIPGRLEALRADVAARPDGFTSSWEFERGTRRFIHQDATLSPWGDWLLQLLDAVEAKGRSSILAALDEVRTLTAR